MCHWKKLESQVQRCLEILNRGLFFRLNHSIPTYHNLNFRKLLNYNGISLTFRIDLVNKTRFLPHCFCLLPCSLLWECWKSLTFLYFSLWENTSRQLSFLSSVLKGQSNDCILFLRWYRGISCFLSRPLCRLGSRSYRNAWMGGQRRSRGWSWTEL